MKKTSSHSTLHLAIKILGAVALVGGTITLALLAPRIAPALKFFLKSRKRNHAPYVIKNRITITVQRLMARGLLKKDKDGYLSLTAKGDALLLKYQLHELRIPKPRRWDGKWRVVMFDVWESRKPTRELLRKTLRRLGMVRIQDSVWVHPYNCEDIIALLRTNLRASPAIQYMVVECMDRDHWLRTRFDLSS